ncbi:MAG: hypothetical protein M3R55_15705 [Acidobacteriota bacterium]|nr:hypothetical protein [Acidobacteriota bacterium]
MTECAFENDVLDALASRRWPARIDEDLRMHVASCEACADLAAAAGALMNEQDTAYAEARMPSSASVWHRAQMRAREESVRAATRPIGFVQGVAFACALALTIGVAAWGLPFIGRLLPDLSAIVGSLRALSLALPRIDADVAALLSNSIVQLGLAAWLLLAPVAVYFAVSRE